jgi:hypothetical protein
MEQLATFEPSWWPSDQALVLINWVHETAGFPCYAYAIGATTLAFRLTPPAPLNPVFIVHRHHIVLRGTILCHVGNLFCLKLQQI